jgi:hypothetical protein
MFQALWALNVEALPGSVVVARHLGDRNAELIRALPDHRPIVVREPRFR